MRCVILAATAAVALASAALAQAPQQRPAPASPQRPAPQLAPPPVAAPPPQDGQQWIFDDNPDEPTLQYATPDSDVGVIAITCEPKNRIMRVSEFVGSEQLRPGVKATLKLTAGTASLDINGDAVANEVDGGVNITASGAPNPRLFALLRAGPALKIDLPGNSRTVPLAGAAPHVAAMEKLCAGRR